MSRLTTEEFISRANKVHGDIYDYGEVKYVNAATKVTIGCKKHGNFTQRPGDHTRGQGCPKCGYDKNRRDKQFIERAKSIHGDKYDYSEVVYKRTDQKVTIICPDHGKWQTKPMTHLSGSRCPKCASLLTHDEFLQKAFDIHGPKYNYDKTIFTETRNDVIITCLDHGDFVQRASAHLLGNGCKQCADDKRRLTTEDFIQRSHDIHEGFYDYSKTDYVNSHQYVTITCPIHGDFQTKPYNHLQGRRCRRCFYDNHPGGYTEEVFKLRPELRTLPGVFYITEYEFPKEHFIKVGITQHTAYSRAKSYWQYATVLVETPLPLYDAFVREQEILHRSELQQFKYYPKSIRAGNTECFTLDVKPYLF